MPQDGNRPGEKIRNLIPLPILHLGPDSTGISKIRLNSVYTTEINETNLLDDLFVFGFHRLVEYY
jgi:hypothetical protein